MSVPIPNSIKPTFTVHDYMKKKEGRWELINGEFYDMSPAPHTKHQWIAMQLAFEIQNTLSCKDRCKVFVAPIDYVINNNTVLQPDVAIFCVDDFPQNLTTPPIFLAEILSKSTSFKDRVIKLKIYESQKIPYYLIVEPFTEFAELFVLKDGVYVLQKSLFYNDLEHFKVDECEFSIDFSNIFSEDDSAYVDNG